MSSTALVYTSEIGRSFYGNQRHVLRLPDMDRTACGRKTNHDWYFGEVNPPTNTARTYWCPRCFPDEFTIVSGRRMVLSGRGGA